MSQFHGLFYGGRFLPNCFGCMLTNVAFGLISSDRTFASFCVFGFAGVLFRSEVVVLGVCVGVCSVVVGGQSRHGRGRGRLGRFVVGVAGGIFGVLCGIAGSLLVDTYFWGRVCAPELEVLYFNGWLNRSSEWGRSPWWWYFAIAVPKSLLLGGVGFVVVAVVLLLVKKKSMTVLGRRAWLFLMSSCSFMALYSLLPHKEWRFVWYVVPPLTAVAAIGAGWSIQYVERWNVSVLHGHTQEEGERIVTIRRTRDWVWLLLVFVVFVSLGLSLVFFAASTKNYYGGMALRNLHQAVDSGKLRMHEGHEGPIKVHFGVHATMNGVTKWFWNRNQSEWLYSKQEDPEPDWSSFDFLLTGEPEKHDNLFLPVAVQKGFAGLSLNDWRNPIRVKDKIWIMQRKKLKAPVGVRIHRAPKPIEPKMEMDEDEDVVLGYGEKEFAILRVPVMRWYQRWPKLIINMIVYDVGTLHYKFTNRSFTMISELHKAHLEFYTYINLKKSYVKIRKDKIVVVVFKKKRKQNWPRLLKTTLSPDYLRIDWDEWDDDFTVEVQDRSQEHEHDPEADGYHFNFGESFFKKYREKVNPDVRDAARREKATETLHVKEDFTPFVEFLKEEREKVEKKRRKEGKEPLNIPKKGLLKPEPIKDTETEDSTPSTPEVSLRPPQARPKLVSEELPDAVFDLVGWSKESRSSFVGLLREKFRPLTICAFASAYFMFVLVFVFLCAGKAVEVDEMDSWKLKAD